MILNYKYRLNPTKKQQEALEYHIFVSNQIYNQTLNILSENLKSKANFNSKSEIYQKIKIYLHERELTYHSGILQQTLIHASETFFNFFKKRKSNPEFGRKATGEATLVAKNGFAKFRNSSQIQQSFEFKNQRIQITEKYFRIMKMKICWKYHRELPNSPKKVIIKRESDGKFYVIFSVEVEQAELPKTGVNCGIDMNIKNIAIADSTGNSYLKIITKLEKYNKKYTKIQLELSKRYEVKSKSKNTKKMQKKLNKIHKKVRNVKEDFFHKVSKNLVENFDLIRAEKLEKKKMKENAPSKKMRRSIAEVSWNSLIQKIKYKAERCGKVFEEIEPHYTSQRCNCCGHISRQNRKSQEKFECVSCGHKDNADLNAAKNIFDYEFWKNEQKQLLVAKAVAVLTA